ncbi:MAG: hypothetical protein RL701_3160 [Pseudomonadota bacterium]
MIHNFLDFELDETLFELRQRGKPLEIQARVFATLLCLVRNRGRIITRDELTQSVWKDTVVSDAAISQVVMLARKALNDAGPNPQIIRTIRGRGFRFAPPVTIRSHTQTPTQQEAPIAAQPAAAPALAKPTHSEFVGRQEELTRLVQCLDRAVRGRGGLVLLEGEPGSGRSSLVRELSKRASSRSIEAAWGRTWEAAGAPPFWPWSAVLRALVQRHGLERLRALSHEYSHDLAPLSSELGPQSAQAQAQAAAADVNSVQVRFRTFGALSRLLRAVSLESGSALLIILEDVHCADDASLQLLRYLSEEIADMPVLLVVTLDELAPNVAENLTNLLPWTAAHLHRMRLLGLSHAEVGHLLETKLGSVPPPRLVQSLHELSTGNPLLVHALAGRMQSNAVTAATFSAWDLASHPVPERIVAAVRRHMSDLPESTLKVLAAAAAFGREFRVPWLAALLDLSEAELLEALSPALRRSILQANTLQFGTWCFSHAMVRSAVYTALPVRERFELHRRIGELIESHGTPDPLSLHALAHHYLLAGPGAARDKAIEFGQKAGQQAQSTLAYEEAALLYDRVLDLLEASLEAQPQRHYDVLMLAGDAWYRAGQLKRASARFERAATLTSAQAQPEAYGRALCMSALVLRGTLLHDSDLHLRLRQALEHLPQGSSALKALLLAASALGQRVRSERDKQTAAAVHMARQVGDKLTLAWTLNVRHCALWGVAPSEELLAIATETVELARAIDHDELLLDAQLWCMLDRIEIGQLGQALHDHRDYVGVAKPSRSAYHRYMLLTLEAAEAASGGQFARAHEFSDRAREIGRQMHEPLSEAYYEIRNLFLHVEPSPVSESVAPNTKRLPCVQAPACVPNDYHAFWSLAWLRSGHDDQARALLAEFTANEGELNVIDALRRPVWAVLARVAVKLRHRPAAELLYTRLLPYAERHLLLQAGVYLGPVSYYLGLLAVLLDRTTDAARHFEQALHASQRSLTFLARTQFEYAQLLARGPGPRRRAEQLLQEAELNARQTGLSDLLEQLKAPFDATRPTPRASYA